MPNDKKYVVFNGLDCSNNSELSKLSYVNFILISLFESEIYFTPFIFIIS